MIHSHSPIVQHKGDKNGHSSSSIKTLEEAVDDFKAFVDEWKPPRKRDKWLSALGLGSSPESETFTSKYHKFEKTLENVKLLITVEIMQTFGRIYFRK
ncbi:hypothetical protein P3T76_005077 [Phytophthora citrophthora]|uniref:Uncharacterized protein n=1 Tax=Phytophthora citrophthora TaxID=4793 RepID=A0AAD9GT41_9STRA|nr:hypothetical protein P3T76_005077 [Phytophthora citrophthora]